GGGVTVGVDVAVGVDVTVGLDAGVGEGHGASSHLPAFTITFPQSPLCVESDPTYAVTPTVVCPPLTGRYATNESPKLSCATSVAPAASVTRFSKSLLSIVTPAISGCPALKVPSENALNCRFVE